MHPLRISARVGKKAFTPVWMLSLLNPNGHTRMAGLTNCNVEDIISVFRDLVVSIIPHAHGVPADLPHPVFIGYPSSESFIWHRTHFTAVR